MIDLELLLNDLNGESDCLDDYSRCEATTRLLCATARRYNNIYTELERLKESTGFNKPFPILRLPREIRDEIYTYALRADISVDVNPPFSCTLATENPFKPATPGLLRVNKQIYHEAIEILYSKNMFKFQYPRQLFAFEEQIGLENRERMRNICIWIRFPEYQEVVRDPRNLLPSEYDSVPTHWIATLKACRLKNITHLTIEAETITGDVLFLLPMPKDLQESIEQFLERGPNDTVPRLCLTGFQEDEKDKFPKRWEIVMDQWKCYKERMAGIQRELEEYEAYCKTERAFDLQNSDDDEESGNEEYDDEDSDDEQEFYSPLSV